MNTTQFGRVPTPATGYDKLMASPGAPVDGGMGTQSEVMPTRTTAGNNANATTPENTTALGGVNWNKINTSAAAVGTHVQNIAKAASGNGSIAPAISKHIANITKSLKAIQSHPSNPANNSEADAGDMSHWDPTGGLGNKMPNSYSRSNQ